MKLRRTLLCLGFVSEKLLALLFASALMLCMSSQANAQGISTTIDSNSIMGFETPFAWGAKSSASSMIMVSSATIRTQGNFAYSITNPGNLVTLTSAPVASTATALAGVGNPGALFEVDVMLPTQVGNSNNTGQMQMYVNSPSLGLSKVFVGDVLFSAFRPGIYTTMQFPIPSAIASALAGASFTDLTFIFMVSSPGQMTGPYLFDNLRVHSVPVVTATSSTVPPPGYGGSLDFVVFGGTPETQSFDIGPIQVPNGIRLKLGTAGTTTVQLQLGFEGTPSFTCTYSPDPTDTTGKSFALISCTGGLRAGDLVPADWASLAILGGDPSMKIRAQLAKSPIGDLLGGGLLPAMPTFWGDFDACVPALVAGNANPPFASPSPSCAAQTAEANQIVTNYFNQVNSSSPAPNWIVTPKPEFARRFGDGTPHNNLAGPPLAPNDPPVPFDAEGHLNKGGDWDAYYRVSGDIDTETPNSNDFTSQLEADVSGHVVLWGQDVNVLSVNSTVNTDSGQVSPQSFTSPSATGNLAMYLFGIQIGGGSRDATTGFNFNVSQSNDFNLPPIHIWIFAITLGATATVGLDATGTLSPTGFQVGLGPFFDAGAHIEGGVDVVVASGGVDARVDLLSLGGAGGDGQPMITAGASWFVSTDPNSCDAGLNLSLDGEATVSSGGGEVDLVATFGVCPFCYDTSWTLFKWDPLLSSTFPLFSPVAISNQLVQLPVALCQQPLNVVITNPVPGSTQGAQLPIPLTGIVTRPPTTANQNYVNVDCSNFTWSVAPPDILAGQGCNAAVMFAPPPTGQTSQRSVNLNASYTATDAFGQQITQTGSGSSTVTVTQLAPGPYIACVIVTFSGGSQTPCLQPVNGGVGPIALNGISGIAFTLQGVVLGLGPNQTAQVTWSVTSTSTSPPTNATIETTTVSQSNPTSAVTWMAPLLSHGTSYQFTFTTSAPGLPSQSVIVNVFTPTT